MGPNTTILACPGCQRRLRAPTDRGELVLTCPACRWRWDWAPPVIVIDRRVRTLRSGGGACPGKSRLDLGM